MNCPECKSDNTEEDRCDTAGDPYLSKTSYICLDCGCAFTVTTSIEVEEHGKTA
jgi:transposase-like protein